MALLLMEIRAKLLEKMKSFKHLLIINFMKKTIKNLLLILVNFFSNKNYSQNWSKQFIKNTKILDLRNLSLVLEIGCFEGLTSNYIVEKLLDKKNGKLVCVDPLSDEYLGSNPLKKRLPYFYKQFDRFIFNTKRSRNKIELMRVKSSESYKELLQNYKNAFDLIYIDGDHRASVVYNDAVNCFELCKNNGVLIFDDYTEGGDYLGEEATRHGVDKFLLKFIGKYEILFKNSQVALRKNETQSL